MPRNAEFSAFGSVVEQLRKRRGLSTQGLADQLGVSRSKLYRQMTGQSAVPDPELRRFATVLRVHPSQLDPEATGQWEPPPEAEATTSAHGVELEEFVSNMDRIVLTLRNFPGGELGVRLKIGFLNLVEDVARETGNKLPIEYYRIRKEVQDGER